MQPLRLKGVVWAGRCLGIFWGLLWVLVGAGSWGLAQETRPPCAEQPYTLETEAGLAGGGNLEYQDQIALLSDGACVQTQGLSLWAPQLRYDPTAQSVVLENLEAQTPRYRFWAAKGELKAGVFVAEGVRITPCRCGDDLRLRSDRLAFDSQSGALLLSHNALEYRSFGLARFDQIHLDPNRVEGFGLDSNSSNLAALVPLRFDIDQGLNVGLEGLNLALLPGYPHSAPTYLTVLATHLGSPLPTLKLGIAANDGTRQANFFAEGNAEGLHSSSLLSDANILFTYDTKERRAAFRLHHTFNLDRFSLMPFGQIASDQDRHGLAAGALLRYQMQVQEGPWKFVLEPYVQSVFYDQPQSYQAFGGKFGLRYTAEVDIGLQYEWVVRSRAPRFWLEGQDSYQKLSGRLGYGGFWLEAEYDFLAGQTRSGTGYRLIQDFGELWAEAYIRYHQGQWERQELIVGFRPNRLSCTDSFSLSPTLGYDWVRQSVSRAGLELNYADCCFIWKLGYTQVFFADLFTDEVATGKWTFGLELR